MKGSIVDKWQRMYENSEHTEKLQEIIPNIKKKVPNIEKKENLPSL